MVGLREKGWRSSRLRGRDILIDLRRREKERIYKIMDMVGSNKREGFLFWLLLFVDYEDEEEEDEDDYDADEEDEWKVKKRSSKMASL